MNKDKIIIKICKSVIVVFGVLTVFNVIMLINKKSYALFQKTIETDETVVHIQTASELPSEPVIGTEMIKKTIGTPGGVIGVSNNNEPITQESEDIREYRYSGLNVNNYIKFNDEMWRIVGVFKDESNAEHLKIVKNEVLTTDMVPATYTISGTEYKIAYSDRYGLAYWNKKANETGNNDWATAGLQYWLNTKQDETPDSPNKGYLNYLNDGVEDLIETTKYYLGAVTYTGSEADDSPREAYANERKVTCEGNKGPETNSSKKAVEANETCRVWAGNQATWTGKIGLLYPSDYGFSAESIYWDTKLADGSFNKGASDTSWLQMSANHGSSYEWLLSPSSNGPPMVSRWSDTGYVFNYTAEWGSDIHPVLYLMSGVNIVRGTGTESNPYQLGN